MSAPSTPQSRRVRRIVIDQWPVVIECAPSRSSGVTLTANSAFGVATSPSSRNPSKSIYKASATSWQSWLSTYSIRLCFLTSVLLIGLIYRYARSARVDVLQRLPAGSRAFTVEGTFHCLHDQQPRTSSADKQVEIVNWEPFGPFRLAYDCINEFQLTLYQSDGSQHHISYAPDIAQAGAAMHISASYDEQLSVASMMLNGAQQRQYYVGVTAPLHTTQSSTLHAASEATHLPIQVQAMRLWDVALTAEQIGRLLAASASQTSACSLQTEGDGDMSITAAACIRPTMQLGLVMSNDHSIATTDREAPASLAITPTDPARQQSGWSQQLNSAFYLRHTPISEHSMLVGGASSSFNGYSAYGPIPKRIHQTYKHFLSAADSELLALAQSWQRENPSYLYRLWNDTQVDSFVLINYPDFYRVFAALPKPVLKADLFRYMIAHEEGGVYADIDTEALRPVEYWTQPHPRLIWSRTRQAFQSEAAYLADTDANSLSLPPVNVILGVEADFSGTPEQYVRRGYATEHQLCQWTFASVAGHPMMAHVIQSVMQHLLTRTPSELLDANVLDLTGPGIWTTSIRDYLIRVEGLTSADELMGYTMPLQIGDIYILPVNGFGDTPRFRMAGAERANKAGFSPRCVEHHFLGSWKEDDDSWLAKNAREQRDKQIRDALHQRVLNRTHQYSASSTGCSDSN